MSLPFPAPVGWVVPGGEPPAAGAAGIQAALRKLETPFSVALTERGPAAIVGGTTVLGGEAPRSGALPLLAHVPALGTERLGDPAFREAHGLACCYATGAMANGIGSEALVIAMARAGMIGFFGAAGLSTDRISAAIDRIQAEIGRLPAGFNLIHSPQDPRQEQETVDLYLRRGIRTVDAAAYLGLTPMVVQYRLTGVHRGADGRIAAPNRLLAKISREEVAEKFLRPAPEAIVGRLVAEGRLTPEEASLGARLPLVDDLTCEADSGGHTDNRPLAVLLPVIRGLRDRICREMAYDRPVRVGAGGGLGSPESVAAAFSLGAAYVMTGTINQACRESGTSDLVRGMLAEASMVDVAMAPASDMFEAGVQVQVLKRGTLFPQRARQLYDLWREHASWEEIDADARKKVEDRILRASFDAIWQQCVSFFAARDPAQLERAARDPKHRMALVFRWYLGMSSRWAIQGEESRKQDLQVWCGPAIGAFNAWTRGTFLADPAERSAVVVGANLMAGAAAISRARILREQGVDAGEAAFTWTPRRLEAV
jgi:PfaD family protein